MDDRQLYGTETAKAVENFQISGERVPISVIHWLARIKGAAAQVNGLLGKLPLETADLIRDAAARIVRGEFDDQFPVDVFQTGSGTSTNMNVNEVISALTGGEAHPNDHVNMGQSSNDTFPSAVHLAALDQVTNRLLPALNELQGAMWRKSADFDHIVKAGRTHLMDAVPIVLGAEFGGYATQLRLGHDRVFATLPHVAQIPLGGTAVGSGLNTPQDFAPMVRAILRDATGLDLITGPADSYESQANRDALVELSGALKTVAVSLTKIAQDIALMGSGPRAGIGELILPELQKGSSIMPGKVNPVMPEVVIQVAAQVIGNDAAVTIGGMQGQFELNVRVPLIARNVLQSIDLLTNAVSAFRTKCVEGIEANERGTDRSAHATLAVATALNEIIGYDEAAKIVKEATDSDRPLRDVALEAGVEPEVYDRTINLLLLARGGRW